MPPSCSRKCRPPASTFSSTSASTSSSTSSVSTSSLLKLRLQRAQGELRRLPLGQRETRHRLQYLWRKGGLPSQPRPWRPTDGGVRCGGSHPHQTQSLNISAEARPTAALLPPCGDKRVGGALFNYGGIGRGPAVGVADQGGPGLDLLPTFNNISAQPSSPLQPHPHRKRAK